MVRKWISFTKYFIILKLTFIIFFNSESYEKFQKISAYLLRSGTRNNRKSILNTPMKKQTIISMNITRGGFMLTYKQCIKFVFNRPSNTHIICSTSSRNSHFIASYLSFNEKEATSSHIYWNRVVQFQTQKLSRLKTMVQWKFHLPGQNKHLQSEVFPFLIKNSCDSDGEINMQCIRW